jgi:hypothetical protein
MPRMFSRVSKFASESSRPPNSLDSPGMPGPEVTARAGSSSLRIMKQGRTTGWLIALASILLSGMAASGQTLAPFTFSAWQPVGTTAPAVAVKVGAQAAGTVSSVQVVTMGASGLEFADAGGGCSGASFTAVGQTCTESVTFTPKYPGTQLGAIVLLGTGGSTVLGTAYLSGVGQGPLDCLIPGELADFAGSGEWKVVQNGPALKAGIYLPTSIARDGAGNLYIADSQHNMIRKVDTTQTISTIAGNGDAGYAGDNGPAANSTLNTPSGVAVDGAGNLYIADTGNNVIREIVAATGIIKTVAGNGTQGNSGDGGLAITASLNQPLGVTVDIAGNLFIADTGNNRIRKVDPFYGVIAHVAGDPTGAAGYSGDNGPALSSQLNGPNAVAFDRSGYMYIPDSLNNVVRKVWTNGIIVTFAGGGPSPIVYGPSATAAQLNLPTAVIVDPAQNVYIADTQAQAIRKVYAASNYFTTLAELNFAGDFFDGTKYEPSLSGPAGFALDGNGNLYFADEFNNKIREIESNVAILDYTSPGIPTHVGDTSAAQNESLENDGNALSTITSITPDVNAAVDNTVQNACVIGPPGTGPVGGCVIAAEFKPSTTGNPLDAHINITADSVDSPYDIELVGDAIPPSATAITVTANPNPSVYEQEVTFAATVAAIDANGTPQTNLGIPKGTVNFYSDGASIGSAPLDSTGRATLNYASLTVGTHSITANYGGAVDYVASSSSPLSQVVQLMPTITSLGASGSANSSASGALVATVIGTTSSTPVPTGTVTFLSGSTTLGSAQLNADGVATISPQLSNISYTIIAKYSGDAVHAPSSSVAVSVTGNPTDFNITVNPSTVSLATGQNATIAVNVIANAGYADTIGLGCSTLPAGVNCHFSSNAVNLKSGASQTIQLTVDTNNPLSGGSSAMNSRKGAPSLTLAGIFLPAGIFFGLGFRRFRKRHGVFFTAVLSILVSGAIVVAGCSGGFTQSSAKPGTYVFQVTGLGVSSNVAHYQPVTLTITK